MVDRLRPSLFIVGAPKCGTTSLARYLGQHPSVFMCNPKEPHYFATDLPIRQVDTLAGYTALFSRDDAAGASTFGEASSLYLYSSVALANIRRYNPEARLVVMLRDPVDLAQSFHSQMVFNLDETEPDFEEAWYLQDARKDRPLMQYGQIARLGAQVRRLYQSWSPEDVHVILLSELKRDAGLVYRRVLRHLELADDGRTDFPALNVNKVNRSARVARFARRTPRFLNAAAHVAKRAIGKEEWGIMRRIDDLNRRHTTRPVLRREFRAELQRYFHDDVQELSELLGRNLPSEWP